MASDPQPGHLVPIVASLDGIHSRVPPLSAVSIDTKQAQSANWRSHLVHSRLIRIRFLLNELAMLRLSPSCTPCRVYGMCGLYHRDSESANSRKLSFRCLSFSENLQLPRVRVAWTLILGFRILVVSYPIYEASYRTCSLIVFI